MGDLSIFFIYLLINAGLAGLVAYVASQKGRSTAGFFWLSFLLSFVIGFLLVLALPSRDKNELVSSRSGHLAKESDGAELVKCPYCAEWVKSEARICKHCHKEIDNEIQRIKDEETQSRNEAAAESRRLRAIEVERENALRPQRRKKNIITASILGAIFVLGVILVTVVTSQDAAVKQQKAKEIAAAQCATFEELSGQASQLVIEATLEAYNGNHGIARMILASEIELSNGLSDKASELMAAASDSPDAKKSRETAPGFSGNYLNELTSLVGRLNGYIKAEADGTDPYITSYTNAMGDARNVTLAYCEALVAGK